mmetsp:Transcript_30409/g.88682  ORF Transcript_30409/g.88682 Transcript_30409/m.88682 type:complete len:443 (-) Transcript_30409:319-1647(-)
MPADSLASVVGALQGVLSKDVSNAVAQERSLLSERRRVFHRLHRQRRRRRGAAHAAAQESPPTFLVLGFVTNPRTPKTREWIRQTVLVPAAEVGAPALIRFVVGKRGLSPRDVQQLDEERRRVGKDDFAVVDASDFNEAGGIYSCIDKLFAWFRHAPVAYPGASFYAKADDDSFVDVARLASFLRPAAGLPRVYGGYLQYDSFVTEEWRHCGWSAGQVGAAHARRHGCPKERRVYGPFPFVVGALTVMGGDLGGWFASSPHVAGLVEKGRATQGRPQHWDCGYSDVTLGYALGSANLSLSLLSAPRPLPRGEARGLASEGASGACAWRSVGLRCDAGRHVRGDGRESLRRLAPPAQPADVRARGGAGKGAAGVVASPRRVRGVAGRARRGGRRVGRAASGDAHVRVLPAVEAVPARAGGQIGASGRRRECVAGTRTDNRDGA